MPGLISGANEASKPHQGEREGRSAPKFPIPGSALIHRDVECLSADVNLGDRGSVSECASACASADGCAFFLFGKLSKAGGQPGYWLAVDSDMDETSDVEDPEATAIEDLSVAT